MGVTPRFIGLRYDHSRRHDFGAWAAQTRRSHPIDTTRCSRTEGFLKRTLSFFVACCGVLLLVASYHLGATAAGAQTFMTTTTLDRVVARSFEIVDASGHTRAELSMRTGQPALTLLDSSGHMRAVVALDESGSPMIGLTDPDGSTRAAIATSGNTPALTLTDSRGVARAQFSVASGVPAVSLMDASGAMLTAMGVTEVAKGQEVGSFVVFNRAQEVLWYAPK